MAGGCSGISLCLPIPPLHKGAGGLPHNMAASGHVSLCKGLGAPRDEAGTATLLSGLGLDQWSITSSACTGRAIRGSAHIQGEEMGGASEGSVASIVDTQAKRHRTVGSGRPRTHTGSDQLSCPGDHSASCLCSWIQGRPAR